MAGNECAEEWPEDAEHVVIERRDHEPPTPRPESVLQFPRGSGFNIVEVVQHECENDIVVSGCAPIHVGSDGGVHEEWDHKHVTVDERKRSASKTMDRS